MWKVDGSSEDVRVDEGLYLTALVDDSRPFGRPRELRSSFLHWRQSPVKQLVTKKWSVDRECGICFELAVNPRRTRCCGSLFCSEHLIDWLGGDAVVGSCPSCQTLCSINANTISLASPPKPTLNRSYCRVTSTPNENSLPCARHHLISSSIPSMPHGFEPLPSSSSRPSCASSHSTSVSKSESHTHIAVTRTGSPSCAPSRPNTPCSVFSHANSTCPSDPLPFRSTPLDNCVPGFSVDSFTIKNEDNKCLLLLVALAACIYFLLAYY